MLRFRGAALPGIRQAIITLFREERSDIYLPDSVDILVRDSNFQRPRPLPVLLAIRRTGLVRYISTTDTRF